MAAKKKTVRQVATAAHAQYLQDAQHVIGIIDQEMQIPNALVANYKGQRVLLDAAFASAGYSANDIITRLIILDQLYSTNVRFSHFALDEMADAILRLGSRQQAADYFYNIATGGEDSKHLFDTLYGHNGSGNGVRRTSHLSKYAYYELLQNKQRYPLGFPIYDALALDMIPLVFANLRLSPVTSVNKMRIHITDFVANVDKLRTILLGNYQGSLQPFDILDAYLWRIGKFRSGNLTLLFDKEDDYKMFIKSNAALANGKAFNANAFASLSNATYLTALYNHQQQYFP